MKKLIIAIFSISLIYLPATVSAAEQDIETNVSAKSYEICKKPDSWVLPPKDQTLCNKAIADCQKSYGDCVKFHCTNVKPDGYINTDPNLYYCSQENIDTCNWNNPPNPVNVLTACAPALPVICGDGVVDSSEGCDDANLDNSDGCDKDCHVEVGWSCDNSSPSVCELLVKFFPVTIQPAPIEYIGYTDINKMTYPPNPAVPNANPIPNNPAVDNVDVGKIDLPNGSDPSDPKPMVSMYGGGGWTCSMNTFDQVSPWTTYVMFLGLGLLPLAIRRSKRMIRKIFK